MTLVSGSIPNFINGISQQPETLRLASQLEEQVNGYSVVSEGLIKRPGTEFVKRLSSTKYFGAHTHFINRDASERYIVIITNGNLQVYDLAGNAKTVNFPNGTGYLSVTGTADDAFAALTVLDYTFIVNRQKVVQKLGTTKAVSPPQGLVWVRQGAYGTVYGVKIDVTDFNITTPDGSVASHSAQVATNAICSAVAAPLDALADFECPTNGSVMRIKRADNGVFQLGVNSAGGGTFMTAIKGSVRSFTDLPQDAFDGFQVLIRGSEVNGFDDYWVEYNAGAKAWVEIPEPGRQIALNPATMPHGLVRESDGTFTFKQLTWDECKAGSEDTCPTPSFVGATINDLVFYRDRLGFLAGESLVLSQVGNYFNHWRQTSRQLLDDDRIDVSSTHVRASILKRAVIFDQELLLFSDQTQFTLKQGDILSPTGAALVPTTEYEIRGAVRPVAVGNSVFFAVDRGKYTAIREMVIKGAAERAEAPETTAHVPRYIPPGCRRLIGSANEDTLFVLSTGNIRNIWVYRWFISGDDKVQASWSRWEMPIGAEVLDMVAFQSEIWMVAAYPGGTYLEKMRLDQGRGSAVETYFPLCDRVIQDTQAVSGSVVYSGGNTSIGLPWTISAGMEVEVIARQGHTTRPVGYRVLSTEINTTTISIPGNWVGQKFWVGVKYKFQARLSRLMLREDVPGGGQSALTAGRLIINFLTLNFAETGYLRVEVTPRGRDTYTQVFSGYVLGSSESVIGQRPQEDGKIRVGIMSAAENVTIDIINDTPHPSRLLTAEWSGRWTARAVRRA